MGQSEILVWLDRYTGYERVGAIADRGEGLTFAYDAGYQGPAISHDMPVGTTPMSSHRTETYFHYLTFATRLVRGACANAFGESMGLLCHVFLDYLLGNCDNHLKNFSVLYDQGMLSAQLSPAYDILDTTVYARVATEMGVPLSFDRSIVGVTKDDLVASIRHAGFPERLALAEFETLRDDALRSFSQACDLIAAQGYGQEVDRLAGPMATGLRARAGFTYTEASRIYVDDRDLGLSLRK